jgi:D-mannonate dehydratase
MDYNIERIDSAPAHMAGFSSRDDYLLTQQEAEDRKFAETHRDLQRMIARGDANAVCNFAPTVDWVKTRTPVSATSPKFFRAMTVAEVLNEGLDCNGAPTTTELIQLVLNASRSTDIDLALHAGDLIDKLAVQWVNNMTGEVQ